MSRHALYSSARRRGAAGRARLHAVAPARTLLPAFDATANPASNEPDPREPDPRSSWLAASRAFARCHSTRLLWGAVVGLAALLAANVWWQPEPAQRLTQKDIDAAVLHTLQTQPLPSVAADAAQAVGVSVVRVIGYGKGKPGNEAQKNKQDKGREDGQGDERENARGIGTGVVIVDDGTILTNLHVVLGAEKIRVTFVDGVQSDAVVTAMQPEDDDL